MSTKKVLETIFGGKVSSQMKTEKLIWRGKKSGQSVHFPLQFHHGEHFSGLGVFLGLGRMSLGEMAAIKS
jgi:hypothetical protein